MLFKLLIKRIIQKYKRKNMKRVIEFTDDEIFELLQVCKFCEHPENGLTRVSFAKIFDAYFNKNYFAEIKTSECGSAGQLVNLSLSYVDIKKTNQRIMFDHIFEELIERELLYTKKLEVQNAAGEQLYDIFGDVVVPRTRKVYFVKQ
jgi:hypothetical protein